MKKLFFTLAVSLFLTTGLTAQNRSINFEESKVWTEIIAKAKAENKLIFVDCYTDWCGPCKMLANNVFTQDAVADFFNENFINAKFEMEKDADGVAHKEVWGIAAFPTLIFVDPKTDKVVHRLVGAGKADWLIEGGKVAMDPALNLNALINRYGAGERDPKFIATYLEALKSAYMAEEQARVAIDYLEKLSARELATEDNWLLVREHISDPLSKPMREVMANRQMFYDVAGQDVVDRHLAAGIMQNALQIAHWSKERNMGPFDEEHNARLDAYLRGIDFPAAGQALPFLETAALYRKGDWNGLLKKVEKVMADGTIPGRYGDAYFNVFIEKLVESGDAAAVREGVRVLDAKIAATDDFFAKANLSQSKYRLLTSIGDKMGADKAKMDEDEYTKEGEAASGGRAVRAIRMN